MYYCALYLRVLEHTPQNVCLLCNLVRFGVHYSRTFSYAWGGGQYAVLTVSKVPNVTANFNILRS